MATTRKVELAEGERGVERTALGLLVLLALTLARPPLGAAAAEPPAGRLGGTRASFEARYGPAIDDSDWPDVDGATISTYQSADYGGIQVVSYGDVVARVSTFLQGGESWEPDQAEDAIRVFAPRDAEFEDAEIYVFPGDVGSVVGRNGRSEAVAGDVPEGAYRALDAPGDPGDISAHVTSREDGTIVGIGVFLGLVPTEEEDPRGADAALPLDLAAAVPTPQDLGPAFVGSGGQYFPPAYYAASDGDLLGRLTRGSVGESRERCCAISRAAAIAGGPAAVSRGAGNRLRDSGTKPLPRLGTRHS